MSVKYDPKLYLQMEKDYKLKPELVRKRLYNIKTYHKHYLHLLNLCKHERLKDDIYNMIIEKLNIDVNKYNHKKPISTLAKWLPRENTSFDKKLNFVEIITTKMYPHLPRGLAFKTYRKLLVKLCKKLNITETILSQKKYEDIDFKKVPLLSMRSNMRTFLKNDITREKLEKYLLDKYIKFKDKKFIEMLLSHDTHPKEKEYLIKAFAIKKREILKNNSFLHFSQGKFVIPVIDLSKESFESEMVYKYLIIILIVLQSSNKFIVNSKNPEILNIHPKMSIFKKTETIINMMNNCDIVDVNKINELVDVESLLVLSKKPIVGKLKNKRNKIFIWPKKTEKKIGSMVKIKNTGNSLIKLLFTGFTLMLFSILYVLIVQYFKNYYNQ